MNTVQRIIKNSAVMFAGHITRRVFAFIYTIFLARYLGANDFGVFSFAFALTGLFVVFVDLGLDQLTVREVARDKTAAAKYLGNLLLLKILLGLGTFGLIALYINILNYPDQTVTIVYLFGAVIVIRSLSNVFYAVFKAFERMEFVSLGLVMDNFLLCVGVFIGISLNFTLINISLLFVAVSLVDFLYVFAISLKHFVRPYFLPDRSFWKTSIAKAWPLGLTSIFVTIYFRIDTVMLSQIKGDTAVGLYSAAYRLSENALIIPSVFVGALFPVMSNYFRNSLESFKRLYSLSMKFLVYIALPMAVVITLISEPIIRLVYGGDFLGSIAALQVLIWASALMYVTIVQGSTFIASNNQILNMKICGVAVLLNIVLNLIAIPRYGYLGASLATVITELFGFLVGLYYLNSYGFKLDGLRVWLLPLTAFVTAGSVMMALLHFRMNSILAALVFCLVYFGFVLALGIRKRDLRDLAVLRSGETLDSRRTEGPSGLAES